MKKYFYFLSVIAMAMLAVSCDDIEGDNPNEDVPEIIDPFLGDVLPNDYITNQENFSNFTNVLLNSCYSRTAWYMKQSDNTWIYHDCGVWLGSAGIDFVMIDAQTLITWTTPDYDFSEWFNKYSINYNPEDATITTTEILPDGTTGQTYYGTLLATNPRVIIEGKFCGLELQLFVNDIPVNKEARWCLEEFDKRSIVLEQYAKWLSEQEQE
ncbi:MAG: hypothetical protein ACI35T_01330 [Alistipes sp.]